MTLDEAIVHCKEKADEIQKANEEMPTDCKLSEDLCECAREHEQLASWLEELKTRRESDKSGDLISREALKEQINATDFDFGDYYDNTEEIRKRVCEAIDNAPTVEPARLQGDLIRRSDALKAVDNRHEELLHDTEYLRKHCQIDLLGIKKHILAIPPVDAIVDTTEVRPKGEWIDYDNTFYKCPECGYLLEKDCPRCQNKVILPKGGAE